MPEILERLTAAGVKHSGLLPDHAGISGVLAERLNKIPAVDRVAGWRTCTIARVTGPEGFGVLSFGAGAAVSPDGQVALGATYVLRDGAGERVLWIESDTALIDSAACEDTVRRLADGLVSNLQAALSEFHKTISKQRL
jgi:hypothetical protein